MLPIDEIGTVEFPMYAMSATVTVVGRAARTVEVTERDGRLRRVVLMLEHTQETFCDDGTIITGLPNQHVTTLYTQGACRARRPTCSHAKAS